ncbi:helix-turn-helix transcriptional regulator [Clostridium sp. UBA4548]|uniref:helix-turn-helix transcriptional regulator n=1 Tax=Clostridium sp. UBA4548 TaxID=1946361 RepID=UPI0025BAEAFA|nr:helix-turn-helix transcriptional regulator [Clostridium sp. UBA4548]
MKILSLGEKIKLRRKELNLTLKNLAGDRITAGQISLVESSKSNPSMDLLEYLAATLNVSVEYLMETEETQADKICRYYENIAESNILNEELVQAEKNIETSLFYAEKYELEVRKAKNLYLKATIYVKKGDSALAQQFLLTANSIFIKNNLSEDVINTFILLGSITMNLKAYHSAYSYFQQAEKVFQDSNLGDDFLIGQIYYYIGCTFFKLGMIDKSIKYSYLAQEKFKKIDNKKAYAASLMELSKGFSEKGDMQSAILYSEKSIKIYREINNNSYVAEIENEIGKLFSEFDNLEESFIHLFKAKEIREKSNDGKIVETLCNICENYIKLKDEKGSKEMLGEILGYLESGNDKNERTLCDYYLLKYRVELLEGKLNEAENTLIQTLNFVTKMGYKKECAEISIILGKFYIDNGRDSEAAKYLSDGVKALSDLNILKDF